MSVMGVINRGTSQVLVELTGTPATRLLERAVAMKAVVHLDAASPEGGREWSGRVVAREGPALVIELEDSDRADIPKQGDLPNGADLPDGADIPGGAYYDAILSFDTRNFLFDTHVLDRADRTRGKTVRIAAPYSLRTKQRRRFVRATVADSTSVHVGLPDQFDDPHLHGVILNISQDGLACRVSQSLAGAYRTGQAIGVSFTLATEPEPFRLNGAIKSVTPGGTVGTVILGMHFETTAASRQQRNRLMQALRAFG